MKKSDVSNAFFRFLDSVGIKVKDEESEEEKKKREEEEEKKTKDAEEAGIESRLAKLEAIIAKMVESDKEVHKEVASKDAEEEEEEKKKKEEEEKKKEAEDCAMKAKDAASYAEILSPGMTTDGIKTRDDLIKFKRDVLVAAYKTEDGKFVIEPFTGGPVQDFSKLSDQTIDSAFIGAAEVMRYKNNKRVAPSGKTVDFRSMTGDIRSINDANKAFWKSGQAK